MKERLFQLWRVMYPVLLFEVVMNLVAIVVSVAHSFAYMFYGLIVGKDISGDALEKFIYKNMTIYSIIASVVTVGVFLILMWLERKKYTAPKEKITIGKYLLILLIGITACMGVNGLIDISGLYKLFPLYEEEYVELLFDDNVIITIISSVILAPILEEIVFRRFVFKRMRENVNYLTAAVLSSLIFGVIHGNMIQAVFAFTIGMLLCYLYEKYNNLIAPIFLHAMVNGTSVALMYIPFFDNIVMTGMQYTIFSIACVLVMLVLCKFIGRDKVREV